MFCFKLWSRFGVFRDPLTITQNLTFPIPPKTTIGGILASILGIDYNEYFNDLEFFNFKYSLVIKKEIRKKSFAQNYVADYTKKSQSKITAIENYLKSNNNYDNLVMEKERLEALAGLSKKEEKFLINADKKIEAALKKLKKASDKCEKAINNSLRGPKPIYRELLIEPEYLIFIKDFKYEKEIIPLLQKHFSSFSLYMGNSEFQANYMFMDCEWEPEQPDILNSFTAMPSKILFEAGKKYTNVYMATKATGKREYRDYKNFVICDKTIKLKGQVDAYGIRVCGKKYYCEFV